MKSRGGLGRGECVSLRDEAASVATGFERCRVAPASSFASSTRARGAAPDPPYARGAHCDLLLAAQGWGGCCRGSPLLGTPSTLTPVSGETGREEQLHARVRRPVRRRRGRRAAPSAALRRHESPEAPTFAPTLGEGALKRSSQTPSKLSRRESR